MNGQLLLTCEQKYMTENTKNVVEVKPDAAQVEEFEKPEKLRFPEKHTPLIRCSQGLEGIRKQCADLIACQDWHKQHAGKRLLARYDLRFLCRDFIGNQYWDDCHDKLQEFFDINEEAKRKLILLPRGHMKSNIITVGGSIQQILRNPDIRILIANAIWDNSRGFVRQIAQYLDNGTELKAFFGDFKPTTRGTTWSKDSITIQQRRRPQASGTVVSTGVDRVQTSQHYDLIIMDDVVSEENIGTKEQREKIKRFYKNCLSLLDPNGEMWVIGTTWHEDDLYNDLIKAGVFKVYKRPALEPPNLLEGVPIHPKRFSLETLKNLRAEMGPFKFHSQLLLDPYPEESIEFRREWLKYYQRFPVDDEGARVPMYVSVCLDPSLGKDTSDFSGITATGVTRDGIIYVLECRRFKCQIQNIGQEVVNTLINLENQGIRTDVVAVEGFGFQQILEIPLRSALAASGFGSVLVEVLPRNTDLTKDARILSMVPYFADGKIFIREDMVDLKDEMAKFKRDSRARMDDLLDSLAWNRRYWSVRPFEKKTTGHKVGTYGALFEEFKSKRRGKDLWSDFR